VVKITFHHGRKCCPVHGCQWSDPGCPVVAGKQEHDPCLYCIDALVKRVKEWCAAKRAISSRL